MLRIARAPPVVGLALAAGAGALLNHLSVPLPWTLLPLLLLLRPKASSRRPPTAHLPLAMAFLAGGLVTQGWLALHGRDCRLMLRDDTDLELRGRLQGRVVEGRGEILVKEGLPDGCQPRLRVVLTPGALEGLNGPPAPGRARAGGLGSEEGRRAGEPLPGASVLLKGRWRKGRIEPRDDPLRAGYLRVESVVYGGEESGLRSLPGRWRGRVQLRLGSLFPSFGPLVEALVLARKEGLSPSIRESFASAGTAHLLAISGFHVGVVGGLLLLLGGWLGFPPPRRYLLGSLGIWGYVLFIGFPDAALRAALIMTLLALGRLARRPVSSLGALGTTFLVFLLLDPGGLLRPGFQLSFSGAFGLVVWGGPLAGRLEGYPLLRGRRLLASGVSAGISATLGTLPFVVWHFGRVSLVGIPVTLLGAPLITLAIPGILLSLFLSVVLPPVGILLARGVEVVLWLLTRLVVWAGSLPWATVWISRPGLLAGMAGLALMFLWHRARAVTGARRRGRIPKLLLGASAGILAWPLVALLATQGAMEVVMLDVGQGDAFALRSPRGRWVLVDTGPRTASFDAGAQRVLPFLRRRGVGRLELLVLTHPDMDHVGGAESVLKGIPVRGVMDPGTAVGTDVFFDVLETAEAMGIPWRVARAGDSLDLDGVILRVLWPPPREVEGVGHEPGPLGSSFRGEGRALADEGPNEASVVLEVRFGDFSLLLTGDAPTGVEEEILPLLASPKVQVLKVGHHGSPTSSSPELLERLSSSAALISVGRRNRYGHPHPEVLRRLEAGGLEIFRTDLHGGVVLRARRNGHFWFPRLTLD